MRVGVIGSGRIGGNLGRLLAAAGHEVIFSFSRATEALKELAAAAGPTASAGSAADAAQADVVVLSVPWGSVEVALEQAGDLSDRVVIDTTNPFAANGLVDLGGLTSAQYNAARLPGSRLVKAFNTLTAGFQARAAGRTGADRVVMFYVSDDRADGDLAARVIEAAGFAPMSLGGLADSAPMEAPRRPGAVYGEEWNSAQALAFAQLWRQSRAGRPDSFVRRYIRAFATADLEALRGMYADDVVLYTPLAWGARGWPFIAEFITAFHTANPGMRTTLHDEFYDPTGTRACFRFVLHWHNTGPFFGHPPTGDRGTMSETHAIRIEDGRIVEQWVGDNSFQLPYQELVQFGMDFPRDTPDPNPALLDVTAPAAGGERPA